MYRADVLYLELLENIIFVQSKVLESQWSINYIYSNYDLSELSQNKPGEENNRFKINLFKDMFTLFKKEIFYKYEDIYEVRRHYQVFRFHDQYPINCQNLNEAYSHINNLVDVFTLNSKLNKVNYKNK